MPAKAQSVRVLDVIALGPFMIWAGYRARDLPMWARVTMILSGAGTIAYNGLNFAEIHERDRRLRALR